MDKEFFDDFSHDPIGMNEGQFIVHGSKDGDVTGLGPVAENPDASRFRLRNKLGLVADVLEEHFLVGGSAISFGILHLDTDIGSRHDDKTNAIHALPVASLMEPTGADPVASGSYEFLSSWHRGNSGRYHCPVRNLRPGG